MPTRSVDAASIAIDWRERQKRWADSFRRAAKQSGLSLETIALEVGIDEKTLRNYLETRTVVDARFLGSLAHAVNASVLEWAAILGFVPEQLLLAGQSLERSRREVVDLQQRVTNLQRHGVASGAIAQAALDSGGFKVAIEPWLEGPVACRLRLGDLLRISRRDAQPFRVDEIRGDPLLGDALSLANAVRQPANVWSVDEALEGDVATQRRDQWIWVVPRLNITRPPAVLPVRLAKRSIAIVSTQVTAWTTDVAMLVGTALGYATTSTGILSANAFGEALRDEPFDDPKARKAPVRAAIAADFLTHAKTVGDVTVWAHTSLGAHHEFCESLTRAHPNLLVVNLRPSDRLHAWLHQGSRRQIPIDDLESSREALDSALAQTDPAHVTFDVGFPSDIEPAAPLNPTLRDALLERSIITSLRVLRHLRDEYQGPSLGTLHDDTIASFRELASTVTEVDLDDSSFALTEGRRFE